jgi:hypothetical protein
MNRNYSKRLANLKSRRQGLESSSAYFAESFDIRAKKVEAYEKRSGVDAIRYALGAMQEVEPAYTAKGKEEAFRVGETLKSVLSTRGITIELALQGSVPLNVHTRGASDVDLLALHNGFVTSDAGAKSGSYYNIGRTVSDFMVELRSASEDILTSRYHAATVDIKGAKSIKMSGGSLVRTVDVVPSHWHDTAAYQISGQRPDRGVNIWNKVSKSTVRNMPFLHIQRVIDKCQMTGGGCRKVIRLVKNIKKDAEAEGTKVELSSYDVAALMWHCDPTALNHPAYRELALLDVAQSHLEYLADNPSVARGLWTPDGSRRILDDENKIKALGVLAAEVSSVHEDVGRSLINAANYFGIDRSMMRRALRDSFIAA